MDSRIKESRLKFLIETENDNRVMESLGGFYYDKQKFALAEKYYLMSFNNGNKYIASGLGFIYYYGRNGERDFKKAFYYFDFMEDFEVEEWGKEFDSEEDGKVTVRFRQNQYLTARQKIFHLFVLLSFLGA